MCLIILGYKVHPRFRLVLTANRDEFLKRPTAAAHWWEDHPELLGGRDLQGGGTWIGVHKSGKWGAVTNYREPIGLIPDAPSRGELIPNFLLGSDSAVNYLQNLKGRAQAFNGFNLLLDDGNDIAYFGNRAENVQVLEPGIYGLSNALLNTSWPKVDKGREGLRAILEKGNFNSDALFDLMANTISAPDDELPDTGVGLELERQLSPMCISMPEYGTRVSTNLLIGHDQKVHFEELSRENEEKQTFQFQPEITSMID